MRASNSHYEDLAARLRELRTILDGRPNASDYLEFFDDFLAHNEFGLALHAVCGYLMEQDERPDSATIDRIHSLQQSMSIVDDCVDQLRAKARKA